MNRQDKIFIVIVIIATLLLFVYSNRIFNVGSAKATAVVYYKNKEIARYGMDKNETYTHQGTLGDVVIEIKDERVRVVTETSPLHICSIQGWVKNMYVPIVCLPNDLVVQIESDGPDSEIETPDVDGKLR